MAMRLIGRSASRELGDGDRAAGEIHAVGAGPFGLGELLRDSGLGAAGDLARPAPAGCEVEADVELGLPPAVGLREVDRACAAALIAAWMARLVAAIERPASSSLAAAASYWLFGFQRGV